MKLHDAGLALGTATSENVVELCRQYLALLAAYRAELYKLPDALDLNLRSAPPSLWGVVISNREAIRAAIEATTRERHRTEALLHSFTVVSGYEAVETLNRSRYKGHDDWKLSAGGARYGDSVDDGRMTIQETVETASLLRREEHVARSAARGAFGLNAPWNSRKDYRHSHREAERREEVKSKDQQLPAAAEGPSGRPEKRARVSGSPVNAGPGGKLGTIASQTKTTRRLDRAVKREADNRMAGREKAVERWEGEAGAREAGEERREEVTDAQLGELIEGIASNEGIELEVFVQTAAVDSLMVTLYSTGASKIREEFVAPRPELGGAREEFIDTVREHISAIKRKLEQA